MNKIATLAFSTLLITSAFAQDDFISVLSLDVEDAKPAVSSTRDPNEEPEDKKLKESTTKTDSFKIHFPEFSNPDEERDIVDSSGPVAKSPIKESIKSEPFKVDFPSDSEEDSPARVEELSSGDTSDEGSTKDSEEDPPARVEELSFRDTLNKKKNDLKLCGEARAAKPADEKTLPPLTHLEFFSETSSEDEDFPLIPGSIPKALNSFPYYENLGAPQSAWKGYHPDLSEMTIVYKKSEENKEDKDEGSSS